MKLRYFDLSEFDSPDLPGSGSKMSEILLCKLDDARNECNRPWIINSGYRTAAHNKKVGGVSNSSHLKGLAVDIATRDSSQRFEILAALFKHGFKRIGIANSFIHVDVDDQKAQNVIWTY